jgi:outer membrane lipoprotein-sorting protein
MKSIASIIAIVLVVVVLTPAMPAQDVKPADILLKMANAYEKAEKLSFKSVVNMPMPQMAPNMPPMNITMPMLMKMERPNKFRVNMDSQMMGMNTIVTTVSDGKDMYMHMIMRTPQAEMMNGYQKMEAPKDMSMSAMSSGPMGDMGNEADLMGSLMGKDSKEAMKKMAQSAKMLPETRIGATFAQCYCMDVEAMKDVKMRLWIDKKSYLLLQSRMDMYELMQMLKKTTGKSNPMMQNIQPGQMMLTQEYSDYNLKPTFKPDTFKFTPPPGAKEIDFAAMGGMGGGGASSSNAVKPSRRMK